MATNKTTWLYNLGGAPGPLIARGKFAAGASQAIKQGEILELTGNSNTEWVPIDSDFAMAGNIAIANEPINSGDLAGYYQIIVPRPDDVFEYALATGSALTVGADLFYSASQTVASTGTFKLGQQVGEEHYPRFQNHMSEGNTSDSGTTINSTSYARMTFAPHVSYYAKMQAMDGASLVNAAVADSSSVTNTTTETTFSNGSYTFPAGALEKGDVIHVVARTFCVSTNGTDTLNLKLYLGTEEICATGAVDVANSDVGFVEAWITVRAAGSSGSVGATVLTALGVPGTAAALPRRKDAASEDLSGAVAVALKATWSAASASNDVICEEFIVSVLRRGAAL